MSSSYRKPDTLIQGSLGIGIYQNVNMFIYHIVDDAEEGDEEEEAGDDGHHDNTTNQGNIILVPSLNGNSATQQVNSESV